LHEEQAELATAETEFRDIAERFRRVLGNDHPNTLASLSNLSNVLRKQRRFAEAEPIDREVVEACAKKFGTSHERTTLAHLRLGLTLTGLARFSEAETELVEAERSLATAGAAQAATHKECVEALVALYSDWEKAAPDEGHSARATEWNSKLDALAAPADAAHKH
jgi:hypothetical protein